MPTALVTGSSGYIAKHTVQRFLNAGYDVRGSVRRLERGDEVRAAVQPGLDPGVDVDAALGFVALDLGSDDGWTKALEGVDVLVHTASPFPIAQPDNENDLTSWEGRLRLADRLSAAFWPCLRCTSVACCRSIGSSCGVARRGCFRTVRPQRSHLRPPTAIGDGRRRQSDRVGGQRVSAPPRAA